jgi:hypothetical protein
MWLNAQFFIVDAAREAPKGVNERAILRETKERDRVIRDLALM